MNSENSQEIIEARKKFAEAFGNTKLGGKGYSNIIKVPRKRKK
jgi:hypothetical protein